jgi:drug/metabolite transporter (DMT)-like permease
MSAELLYGLVILWAIAHPVWNAMVKSSDDRMLSKAAIPAVGAVVGLGALPFVAWPSAESWKWLALAAVAHFGYYACVIRSYDIGDMSVVYPLARGAVPVLTTIAAFLAIDETLGARQMLAVGLISLGVMALSLGAGASRQAVGFALATSVTIAGYSFFGGVGVRAAGTVLGFLACLEIVNAAGLVGYVVLFRRDDLVPYARRHGHAALLAGVISVLAFLAFLAAASRLPLGPVTALRETSVLFGALIGTLVLKEGFGLRRIAASASVASGVAMLAVTSDIAAKLDHPRGNAETSVWSR